ncbi:MAG: hypothetical protein V4850_23560 [Myxococcota bacterium]
MDSAVALAQLYLRVNGYFTVTEYPVVEASRWGGTRSLTDVDILAFRFPGSGRLVGERFVTDPALRCPPDQPDMLIGEVKEGKADLNRAARDPAVLAAALARFGCCGPDHVRGVVRELLAHGEARTAHGHGVRLVAFGASGDVPGVLTVHFGHVIDFLRTYVRENWEEIMAGRTKDPALDWIVIDEKARRGRDRDE